MKIALALLTSLLILAAVAVLPLPVRPYLDFQVIYHADLGLLRGIPIYDHAGQVNMIAELAKVPPNQVFVLPFPYPPWYALSTVWLALLPIDVAARLWFGLNLIVLFLSVWWLTDGMPITKRGPLFLAAIAFLPVLGSLFVGQYVFPVLLGAALMTYALRRQRVFLTGLAAVFLTFKPHLGALILLLVLAYLWERKDSFGREAGRVILIAGAILFAVGFLASPAWPVDYYRSLTGFRDVSQCHQCTSFSMALAGVTRGGFTQAVWLGILLLFSLVVWFGSRWPQLSRSPGSLVTAGVLGTLLVSPYLQNYDYVLLLVPLFEIAREALGFEWIPLTLAYALPLVSLALFGPAGNVSLVFSALILFFAAARRIARPGELPAAL
jgi:hypothetical protein